MIDLSDTIKANSNHLTADDLLGGAITIKIRDIKKLSGDQPVAIYYHGDNDKPWLPCKTMRRILIGAWGKDGSVYIDRELTLYRDDSVKYAGLNVGGIRISHMSHIDKKLTLIVTMSQGKKAPYTVEPLGASKELTLDDKKKAASDAAEKLITDIIACETLEGLDTLMSDNDKMLKRLENAYSEIYKKVMNAHAVKLKKVSGSKEPPL